MLRTTSFVSTLCTRPVRFVTKKINPISSKIFVSSRGNQTTTSKTNNEEITLQFSVVPETSSDCREVEHININLDDLDLNVYNERFILNLTSLRDFCFCSECMHPNSRQKLFIPKDFKKENFYIREIKYSSAQDQIAVTWQDNHKSTYTIALLRKIKQFSDKKSTQWMPIPRFQFPQDDYYKPGEQLDPMIETWEAGDIMSKIATVDYEKLFNNDSKNLDSGAIFNANKVSNPIDQQQVKVMSQLTKSLVTYGLAKIVNVTQREKEVLNVARCLAYERPTGYGTLFDVVVEPSEDINLAYSSLEFDLHTDLPYRESMPGVQLLHCICNSPEGGYSYFSDGFAAAKKLRDEYPQLFDVLTRFPTTFSVRDPYRNVKFRRQYTIVSLDFQGNINEIHYSPFHLPPLGPRKDIKLFYLALDKFTNYMQSKENKLITKMNPGDLFIFHNRRVLHGRSSYEAWKSRRFLQGCYLDWDEITSLHEKLISNPSHQL